MKSKHVERIGRNRQITKTPKFYTLLKFTKQTTLIDRWLAPLTAFWRIFQIVYERLKSHVTKKEFEILHAVKTVEVDGLSTLWNARNSGHNTSVKQPNLFTKDWKNTDGVQKILLLILYTSLSPLQWRKTELFKWCEIHGHRENNKQI